jgi:hypothetical protein
VSGILMLMVTGGMAVSLSPSSVSGTGESTGAAITVTSATTTASVQGGIAPYTYAWAKVIGDDMTITAPTSATTAFSSEEVPDLILSGTYRCTVTDAAGITARADVAVTLNFVDIS